jgi:heme oxygenase
MNSAYKRIKQKAKRQQQIAELIGWLILSGGAVIGSTLLVKGIQIFFSLQYIH